jgi:hypothetical protein
MGYTLPTFNVPVSIWHDPNVPPAAADVQTYGNLTPGRRMITPYALEPAGAQVPAAMYLLLPAGTDIRDAKSGNPVDLVEVPTGSGRFYKVGFVDDVALGFFNEHRFAQLAGEPTWPVPFPSGVTLYPLAPGTTCAAAALASLFPTYTFVASNLVPDYWYQIQNPKPLGSVYTLTMSSAAGGGVGGRIYQGTCGAQLQLAVGFTDSSITGTSNPALPNLIYVYFHNAYAFPQVTNWSLRSPY